MALPEFTVHELEAGGGILAISPLPGRSRHYTADFSRLLAWGPQLVVTLCAHHELERKGAGGLGEDCAACGIEWEHFVIEDFGVPDADALADWERLSAKIHEVLSQGSKVLMHCFGGCGRSGMAALRILIEGGAAPEAALARLRDVRPCAVETEAQFRWANAGTGDGNVLSHSWSSASIAAGSNRSSSSQ